MKTAVEWYNSKVIELMKQREQGNIDVLEFRNQLDLLLEQAKEMDKKQKIVFAENYETKVHEGMFKSAQQYYNETFKSE
jgi:phage terminase small subunit